MPDPKSILQDDTIQKVVTDVTDKILKELYEILASELAPKISSTLIQPFLESKFYQRISNDMQDGLKRIYKEISTISDSPVNTVSVDKVKTESLFHEASEQLSEVLKQTEKAAIAIMEVVEQDIVLQEEATTLLTKLNSSHINIDPDFIRLKEIIHLFGEHLSSVMLSLSFQDLTGQRIKRAVSALKEIEKTVVELYLSAGLLMQARDKNPNKSIDEIEADTRQQVLALKDIQIIGSELKGPTSGVAQKDIDELMAKLGMD
ncbi:protein phosphatase CheZ [Lawsonia intracellularis]|uniref:Chemotaxis protein n=1 Tax=Lawsonia intracellularis (strain PHE/MN1-00) TaxID=363253 RepID=Q1MPG9_LAWIP|nr:protein phosphatase CheZ [Lawsonia intracellularis]AGC50488.1 chemotaxis protein CheZ [Lawsonia intracellularis N343]KAA0204507.1 chemotaxis protein [Lawsonia intracellularis]MBZ3892937.1 protein phosphatase CheZ [Lawsonia intracellularis]OMQ02297.1 chemotaxis protein [Lawsonia intracellularis]RBN32908.1 chemotaxis protein [Lawsonia intracellularis]